MATEVRLIIARSTLEKNDGTAHQASARATAAVEAIGGRRGTGKRRLRSGGTVSKWDIKPDGVRGVLSRTAEVGSEFEEEFTSYGEGLLGAATCAGTMVLGGTEIPKGGAFGPVAQALQEFQDHTSGDLKFLAVRTGKSITGARLATEEYIKGDLEMARNKQREYSKAPTPEELKGLKK
nr:DUF6507 family protein [Streptomyces sp. DvalAA-43]